MELKEKRLQWFGHEAENGYHSGNGKRIVLKM
jgi:hypothetical protein